MTTSRKAAEVRAIPSGRPALGSHFLVDLGRSHSRTSTGGFSEVIFPAFHLEPAPNPSHPEAEPAIQEATCPRGTLILRRGATGALDLYTWWDQARNGTAPVRKSIKVHLLSEDHRTVLLTWTFFQVRPVALTYSPLRAMASELVIESLELAFGRIEMS